MTVVREARPGRIWLKALRIYITQETYFDRLQALAHLQGAVLGNPELRP